MSSTWSYFAVGNRLELRQIFNINVGQNFILQIWVSHVVPYCQTLTTPKISHAAISIANGIYYTPSDDRYNRYNQSHKRLTGLRTCHLVNDVAPFTVKPKFPENHAMPTEQAVTIDAEHNEIQTPTRVPKGHTVSISPLLNSDVTTKSDTV